MCDRHPLKPLEGDGVIAANETTACVVALAGRRVDADGTCPPRFPLASVPLVRKRLAGLLAGEKAAAVVCSAACGADLIALEEAERLGLRRRIVLPFPPGRFRETSVINRPGDWGSVYDRLIAAALQDGDLIVLRHHESDEAYSAANEVIVREAEALAWKGAALRRALAVVVWEGAERAGSDATEGFRAIAASAGFEERSVLTL
jgi:hypothetical protein